MNTKITPKSKILFATIIAGVGLLSAAAPALATSAPGYAAGKCLPQGGANQACMIEDHGAVKSTCGNQTQYQVALQVSPGSHSASVAAFNPGGGTFSCQLKSYDMAGSCPSGLTCASNTQFINTGIVQQYSMGPIDVPTNGTLVMNCNINPGGEVYNVVY